MEIPAMLTAQHAHIAGRFNQTCAEEGFTLALPLNAEAMGVYTDQAIALCHGAFNDASIEETKSWIDRNISSPGFTAWALFDRGKKLIATQWFRKPTGKDLNAEAQAFINERKIALGLSGAALIYCINLVVDSDHRRKGLGSGLTCATASYYRNLHPDEGVLFLSRIHSDNHSSIASARSTGRCATKFYDPDAQKHIWWGVIFPQAMQE